MKHENGSDTTKTGRQGSSIRGPFVRVFSICLMMIFVLGCSKALRNQPQAPEPSDVGYRYQNIAPGENNSDSLLVLLTFSGGGTRAAAFSYGVLEKLRDTEIEWEGRRVRLLDEVDIISSVSGGSLTSGYYGMFGDRIFEDYQDRVLYRNLQGSLIKNVFALKNQAKLMSSDYGRGELMAEEFDRTIFDDNTFKDLTARNRRPFLIINATDLSRGCRFAFTQHQFDLLHSNLGPYPLGYAVAASAAVPGLLTPITLENYSAMLTEERPEGDSPSAESQDAQVFEFNFAREHQSYGTPDRPYIHLIDGGVSDNLGLLPVVRMLNQLMEEEGADGGNPVKKIVIITVNAKRSAKTNWDQDPASPSVSKTLKVANSAPMSSFSKAQVEYLKLLLEQFQEKQVIAEKLERLFGETFVDKSLEELDMPEAECHFIEVSFVQLKDDEEQARLRELPTSFFLEREDVDRLRAGAGKILDQSSAFQALLQELAPD